MDSSTTIRALAALAQGTRLALFRLLVEQGPAGLTPGRIADVLDVPAAESAVDILAEQSA